MNRANPARGISLAVLASILAVASTQAENWPQWRGPTNDGVSRETNLPAEWSPSKNVVWKLDMPGMGSSTPAVWGKKIFLTSADEKDLVLICVSTEGKELWKRKVGTGDRVYKRDEGSNSASPSPCTDGKHVWAYFGTGDIACFDMDGKEVWKFNVQDRYGKFGIQWGIHNSPLLHEDRLYMEFFHANAAWVVALDKATGAEIWKVKRESDGRGECKEAYTSPLIWTNGKESLLIVHGNDYATAHSLTDGKEIWRVGDLNPKDKYNATLRLVATPVATPDLIVVPTAKGGPVVGIKPGAMGMVNAGSEFELWRMPKGTPDVPSPLVRDGLVYLCREDGRVICLDAKTGKEQYSKQPHGAIHRASPVYADGKLYICGRDGVISVLKAGPTYELLATNKMEDGIAASPSIADGRIYLRTYKTLYAIGNGDK
jgi:outer membrane protein assembly factor BamB